MKVRIITILYILSFTIDGFSILPNGSIAPDWTLLQIPANCTGNNWGPTWNLYQELDKGKHAVIDFSAVWCGPCWSFHNSGILESLWDDYGANGDNSIGVFFIEMDCSSNVACLCDDYGCNTNTWGNWTSGVNFPIFNPSGNTCANIDLNYSLSYFPTVIAVNAYDKTLWEVGTSPKSVWETWLFQSFELKANYNVTDIECNNNGSIDLSCTGGYGTLSYNWSNGKHTQDIEDLEAGTYSVTITDQNGYFIKVKNIEVSDNSINDISVNEQITDVSCWGSSDGAININVSGGSGSFSYNWSNGYTSKNISNLAAGNYALTIYDQSCPFEYNFTVQQPTKLSLQATPYEATCDEDNGKIVLSATGGVKPYRYSIGNGYSSSYQYNNLASGTYDVSILDANDCEYSTLVYVGEVAPPVADAGEDVELSCNQTSIKLDGGGSSSGYKYSYLWTTTDGNIVSGANSLYPLVNKAGKYTLRVRQKAYNCFVYDDVVVVKNTELPNIEMNVSGAITCNNPTVVIDALGSDSSSNYTHQWTTDNGNILSGKNGYVITVDKPGAYTLTVTNSSSGCSTSNTIQVIEDTDKPVYSFSDKALDCNNASVNLCVNISSSYSSISWDYNSLETTCIDVSNIGAYAFTIVGTNGCIAVDTVKVTGDINEPYAVITTPAELRCGIDNVQIDGSESSSGDNIIYLWTTENGNIVTGNTNNTIVVDKAGLYTLKVTNKLTGCSNTESVEVLEGEKLPNAAFEYSIDYNVINLYGVPIEGAVSTWNYDETLQNGDTISIFLFDNGDYTICHYVENSCGIDTSCQTIQVNTILPLSVNSSKNDITCFGYNNGSINIEPQGGILEYSVNWIGPNDFTSTDFAIADLYPGKYDYELVDGAANKANGSITVVEPEEIVVEVEVINSSGTANDGAIYLNVTGGVPPYTYLWNDGSTDKDRTSMGENNYSFTVTDANGCTFEGSTKITKTSSNDIHKFVQKFEVFPNPAFNQTNVEFVFDKRMEGKLKLIDYSGKILEVYKINFKSGIITLDISSLKQGVYLLKLEGQEHLGLRKIVKF